MKFSDFRFILVDTRRKLNVLCTFSLRPVSAGIFTVHNSEQLYEDLMRESFLTAPGSYKTTTFLSKTRIPSKTRVQVSPGITNFIAHKKKSRQILTHK